MSNTTARDKRMNSKMDGSRESKMPNDQTTERCEACGEPATRRDAEGIPLCEGDYWHLMEHWRLEGLDVTVFTPDRTRFVDRTESPEETNDAKS